MNFLKRIHLPFPLLILLLLGLIHGCIYAYFSPPWALTDEEQHFDYIRSLAESGSIPTVGKDYISTEITTSVLETHRHERLFIISWPHSENPEEWGLEGFSYEGYQPPLFYYLCVPVFLLIPGSVLIKLAALRLFMVFLSMITLVVLSKIMQELFPKIPALSFLVVSLMIFIPERAISVSRLNNDVLLEVISALFVLIFVRTLKEGLTLRKGLWLAILFSLGLLTKLSFAGMGILLVFLWYWNRKSGHTFGVMALTAVILILLVGPWLIRNQILYGDFSGMKGFEDLLTRLGWTPWNEPFSIIGLLKQLAITFSHFWIIWWKGAIAVFSWKLIPFYIALMAASLMAATGLIRFLRNKTGGELYVRRSVTAFLGVIFLYVILILWSYYTSQFPVIQGRFLLPVTFIITILMGLGISQWITWKPLWLALLSVVAMLNPLFLFGNQLRYFYYLSPIQLERQGVAPSSLPEQLQLAYHTFFSDKIFQPWFFWLMLAVLSICLIAWGRQLYRQLWPDVNQTIKKQLTKFWQRLRKINLLWYIAAIYFLLTLIWSLTQPSRTFWTLDEGGKFIYLESVLESKKIDAPLIYPGANTDPENAFVPLYFFIRDQGSIFTWWPVWFPLLTLPLYKIFGWIGLFILPAFSGAVCVFLSGAIFQLLQPEKKRWSIITALLVGFATPITFYSTRYWEHTLACALFLLATWLIIRGTLFGKKGIVILAGLSGALASGFRLDVLPILFGFGLFLLFTHRKIAILFGVAFCLSLTPILLANWVVSGNLLGPTFISIQSSEIGQLLNNLPKTIAQVFFNSPAVGAFGLPKWLLITGSLALLAGFISSLIPKIRWLALPFHLAVMGISGWVLFQPDLYRSVHGFVLVSPIVILAGWFFSRKSSFKADKLLWMFITGILVYGIVYLLRAWSAAGGLQWGPRYMLSLYPLLVVLAMIGLQQSLLLFGKTGQILIISITIIAGVLGLGFEVRGLDTAVRTLRLYSESSVKISQMKDDLIFTRCTWLGMVNPDLYWQGNIFAGDRVAWEAYLVGRGIYDYTNLDMESCNTVPINQVEDLYKLNPGGLTIERIQIP